MGSQGIQLYSTLSFCLKAPFVKGQVPKARDVNKSILYKRETEAQEGEGTSLDPQVLLGPSCEVASCSPGGLSARPIRPKSGRRVP